MHGNSETGTLMPASAIWKTLPRILTSRNLRKRSAASWESRMLVDVIDRALLRLKRYPDRGELYYEILTKQFIHRFNSTEKELLDELNMERSVFYDRKREALFLFSVCLFGYAVPELQEELDAPDCFPTNSR